MLDKRKHSHQKVRWFSTSRTFSAFGSAGTCKIFRSNNRIRSIKSISSSCLLSHSCKRRTLLQMSSFTMSLRQQLHHMPVHNVIDFFCKRAQQKKQCLEKSDKTRVKKNRYLFKLKIISPAEAVSPVLHQ